jgi:hypothetical protein
MDLTPHANREPLTAKPFTTAPPNPAGGSASPQGEVRREAPPSPSEAPGWR